MTAAGTLRTSSTADSTGISTPRAVALAALIAVALFAAIAPTLRSLEFSSGSENLLTATIVEMHAGGPWLVPNLNGAPRVRKPPMPAWIGAALVPRSILPQLDSPDRATRDAAYRDLALALRWPPAVMSCLIVLGAFEIARTIAGNRVALISAAVCASSLLLLRYGRSATTDIHLAFWVTMTNLCLLKAVLGRGVWWFLPAGASLGLAFMSKGPVAILQTVVPVILFSPALYSGRGVGGRVLRLDATRNLRHIDGEHTDLQSDNSADSPSPASQSTGRGRWLLAGVAVFLAISLPWFAYVLTQVPGAWEMWKTEVTREGATLLERDPWHAYVSIFPLLAPWVTFFLAGVFSSLAAVRRDPLRWAPLLLVFAPIVVMSCFKDKNERYLIPMVAPAAIVCAHAILPLFRPREMWNGVDRGLLLIQYCVIGGMALGLPLIGVLLETGFGGKWWSIGQALLWAAILVPIAVATIWLSRRRIVALVAGTTILMLLAHGVFLEGYRNSAEGRSELKPLADAIRAAAPTANVYYVDFRESPKALPSDLQIYLNRVVHGIRPPNVVPAPARDVVLIFFKRESEPTPTRPGFREIASVPVGKRSWHALMGE